MKRSSKWLAAAALIVATLACGAYGLYRYRYPFGWSHCCDMVLYNEMERYAAEHDGWFPRGESCPEASLSLLYRQDAINAYNLRGKTVSETVVLERLGAGELLTPETCGWRYVEGLRLDDDPRLGLFWDKAGLEHNGGRLASGGHQVIFVSGDSRHITDSEWPAFVEQQDMLLTDRAQGEEVRVDAVFDSGGDQVQVQLRGVGNLLYGRVWERGFRRSTELLAGVDAPSGLVGQPVVTAAEIRKAKVVVEREKGQVRFVLDGREVVYDGSKFAFLPLQP
jgi:hypothetical protein